MIKLLPFNEFMLHPEFVNNQGLCTNLNRVYCTGPFVVHMSYHFQNYLSASNLNKYYPVSSHVFGETNQQIYKRLISVSNMYTDGQLEQRRDLYNSFARWLIKHYSKEYYCV